MKLMYDREELRSSWNLITVLMDLQYHRADGRIVFTFTSIHTYAVCDMSEFQETVEKSKARHAAVHGAAESEVP